MQKGVRETEEAEAVRAARSGIEIDGREGLLFSQRRCTHNARDTSPFLHLPFVRLTVVVAAAAAIELYGLT